VANTTLPIARLNRTTSPATPSSNLSFAHELPRRRQSGASPIGAETLLLANCEAAVAAWVRRVGGVTASPQRRMLLGRTRKRAAAAALRGPLVRHEPRLVVNIWGVADRGEDARGPAATAPAPVACFPPPALDDLRRGASGRRRAPFVLSLARQRPGQRGLVLVRTIGTHQMRARSARLPPRLTSSERLWSRAARRSRRRAARPLAG
jgi:hypothetical protein